jgi:MFS family permease
LQKVLTIDPLQVGLIMMALPISTVIAGPIGGRLADRYPPRVIAAAGAAITFVAVLLYAQLGVSTPALFVVVPLVLVGLGGGFFRPANQVAVYADIDRRDFGALSAMLTSVGTLAGVLGTTIIVAVTESRAPSDNPTAFTEALQFTFTALLPLLALSAIVSLAGRSPRKAEEPAVAAAPIASSGSETAS